jgi:ankyrin repeat protein
MKTSATISVTIIILLTIACGNNKEKPSNVEAPEMDIHTAAFIEDIKIIKQHIEAGSDLDVREPTVRSTALITASVFGKTEVAKVLIEGGADIDIQNNEGSTALHSAAFLGRIEIVKMLIDKGADQSLRNNAGSTAYESVAGPFKEVKPIYDILSEALGPLGLKLDYEEIKELRPQIAALLK